MEIKKGIGVSPGVVIGTAIVLDAEDLLVPKRHVEAAGVPKEIERFEEAVAEGVAELTRIRDEATASYGKEIGGILEFHMGVLRDRKLLDQIVQEIRSQQTTAEYAVSTVMRRYAERFRKMTDNY